jgi:hypothetical protein
MRTGNEPRRIQERFRARRDAADTFGVQMTRKTASAVGAASEAARSAEGHPGPLHADLPSRHEAHNGIAYLWAVSRRRICAC